LSSILLGANLHRSPVVVGNTPLSVAKNMKKNHHVIPGSRGNWVVRTTNSSRAVKKFSTQQDAVEYGRTLAKKNKTELYIHREDGTIREKDSYGEDPSPSKSRK
jgi:hypothetical protein